MPKRFERFAGATLLLKRSDHFSAGAKSLADCCFYSFQVRFGIKFDINSADPFRVPTKFRRLFMTGDQDGAAKPTIAEQRPMVRAPRRLAASGGSLNITEAAKALKMQRTKLTIHMLKS